MWKYSDNLNKINLVYFDVEVQNPFYIHKEENLGKV